MDFRIEIVLAIAFIIECILFLILFADIELKYIIGYCMVYSLFVFLDRKHFIKINIVFLFNIFNIFLILIGLIRMWIMNHINIYEDEKRESERYDFVDVQVQGKYQCPYCDNSNFFRKSKRKNIAICHKCGRSFETGKIKI